MSAFNFRSFSELAGSSLPVAVSADELFRFKNDLQGFPLLSFSVWVYVRFPVFSVGLSEIWGGQEPTTRSLLGLCIGIFTDRSIFRLSFREKSKGSSGSVTL